MEQRFRLFGERRGFFKISILERSFVQRKISERQRGIIIQKTRAEQATGTPAHMRFAGGHKNLLREGAGALGGIQIFRFARDGKKPGKRCNHQAVPRC